MRYDRIGIVDVKGILRSSSRSEILRYRVAFLGEQAVQRCKDQSAKHGRLIDQFTMVVDMNGFGMNERVRDPS